MNVLSALFYSLQLLNMGAAAQPSPTWQNNEFAVVDVSGPVASELMPSSRNARESWTKACDTWKAEAKEINKNELLGLNCNSASCSLVDPANWQCTSTGTYKVKVPGVRGPENARQQAEQIVSTPPPQAIVEAIPSPRSGFLWIQGYWGWTGRRHIWLPGHWVMQRPGFIYLRDNWVRRDHGWYFEAGRWEHQH